MNRISVLLTSEGTYPCHKGGVSTWCHVLTQKLPEIDFTLLSVVANPYLPIRYDLSANVKQVVKIPLWGTDDPVEYSWRWPFSTALKSKIATTNRAIAINFLPLFDRFLNAILFPNTDIEKIGYLISEMHSYFLIYDYHKTLTSKLVWSTFTDIMLSNWQEKATFTEPTLIDLTEALRLMYRFFLSIHIPIPKTDITHSSAAAFCGLPSVIAKIQRGTPYLLTEHGIYVREQYLNLPRSIPSAFVRLFMYKLIAAVVKVNYHFADIISPVCAYNSRWERWWNIPQEKIEIIYNGADSDIFHPTPPADNGKPIIVNVGLIFPLKGQLDLIAAAAIVKEKFPTVEFRFYGKASDENYFNECKKLVAKHKLEENINFAGFTSEPWRAYSEADIVAMASISEGFPFAVIEAMLSKATLVCTDVGGVREAIADTGILVTASRPMEMAEAIIKLLELPPEERKKYGELALERSLNLFTQKTFLQQHLDIYQKLVDRALSSDKNLVDSNSQTTDTNQENFSHSRF